MRWEDAGPTNGGIVVLQRGSVVVLEFNEFLKRVGQGNVDGDAGVVGRLLTDGIRRRADSLRLFALVREGQIATQDLPTFLPNGLVATGTEASAFLRAIERVDRPSPDARSASGSLLRAVRTPVSHLSAGQLLRAAHRGEDRERKPPAST